MTRPRLKLGRHLLPGIVAVALFGVLAFAFVDVPLTDALGAQAGYPDGARITSNIGYAMFDLMGSVPADERIPSEGFLVAFEIIDVVLVAALVASVMLARREAGTGLTTALGGEDEDGGEQ
jgi:NADH-quinone oxidoreductase subunit J